MSPTPEEMPEAYRRLRARDELFWQDQERNIQGALGQPCCTLSGISSGLMQMRGSFAVVIHGEDECASCFRHLGPAKVNFYCTGLTEKEFVSGRTAEPLRRCLRLVASEAKPEAIFVLGACPVEVIGDQFPDVVADVGREFPDIPMVALRTSGLKVGTQQAMLDWMFESLTNLPTVAPIDSGWRRRATQAAFDLIAAAANPSPAQIASAEQVVASLAAPRALERDRTVAFVGLPRFRGRGLRPPEVNVVLEEVGLHAVGNYPVGASFDEWRAVKFPKASFVADKGLYPRFMRALEAGGQEVVEIPLPVGVAQTTELYEAIGRTFGLLDEVRAAYLPRKAAAEARLATFRQKWGGLRVAYGLRMVNNYEADTLAYQGLGDHKALEEYGFDVTLLVQGPLDKREKFATMFARRNIHLPFEMFIEPWVMADLLKAGGYDVAYLADHCRNEAIKAGVPMINSRTLDPFFEGVTANVEYLDHMLSSLLGPRGDA